MQVLFTLRLTHCFTFTDDYLSFSRRSFTYIEGSSALNKLKYKQNATVRVIIMSNWEDGILALMQSKY